MSNSKFTFIDHKAIDEPESRRVIRSQVMKGRNLGRVLPPRRRPRSKQTDPYEANIRIIEYDPSLLQKMTPGLAAQVGNEFSGFSKIPHMTPRDWKLAYTSTFPAPVQVPDEPALTNVVRPAPPHKHGVSAWHLRNSS